MCTSFVYRHNAVYIAMNFDNDGKECFLSTINGSDFIVSTNQNNRLFPSFGITKSKLFFNDIMVDPCDSGKYKRQNSKRWVTSTLINEIIDSKIKMSNIKSTLSDIELVNYPNSSTHNLLVDQSGNIFLIEPGRKNMYSSVLESKYFTVTNFPISIYDNLHPTDVSGSGIDRYYLANELLSKNDNFSEEIGFNVLQETSQKGNQWKTEFSFVYMPEKNKIKFCINANFEMIYEYDIDNELIVNKINGKSYHLTRSGIKLCELERVLQEKNYLTTAST